MAAAKTLLTIPPFFDICKGIPVPACLVIYFSSNLPIINGLPKEALGISVTSSDKCTLVRDDSYFRRNNLTVLSET